MNSPMFWLNSSDFVKGAVSAVVAAVALSVYNILFAQGDPNLWAVDWIAVGKSAVNAAVAAFVGYLGKNLMTSSNGKVFGTLG